jgi:pimeloyl-ACP methyl ester carboxylesterase
VPLLEGPVGPLHYVVTGAGAPLTLFVPGLAQSIADTRPFASAVPGTRTFVDTRGHGGSAAASSDEGWSFAGLADDVRAVADEVAATQALGVSLGAGALLALMVHQPDRFERVVLALPAVPTEPRGDEVLEITDALAAEVAKGATADPSEVGQLLTRLQPEGVRGRADVRMWARRHTAELLRWPVAGALRNLPRQVALSSLDALGAVTASVLVLAQRDDPVHPVAAAETVADALPDAELVVSDVPWIWRARTQLRETVSAFLTPTDATPTPTDATTR